MSTFQRNALCVFAAWIECPQLCKQKYCFQHPPTGTGVLKPCPDKFLCHIIVSFAIYSHILIKHPPAPETFSTWEIAVNLDNANSRVYTGLLQNPEQAQGRWKPLEKVSCGCKRSSLNACPNPQSCNSQQSQVP